MSNRLFLSAYNNTQQKVHSKFSKALINTRSSATFVFVHLKYIVKTRWCFIGGSFSVMYPPQLNRACWYKSVVLYSNLVLLKNSVDNKIRFNC